MLRIALRALRSRRTQTLTLVILAALVTAATVAAPLFVYAATERLSVRDVAAAPASEHLVTIARNLNLQSDGAASLTTDMAQIPDALRLPGFTGFTAARVVGQIGTDADPAVTSLSSRDGVCARVEIDGACPTSAGAAMISSAAAALTGVRLGGRLTFSSQAMPKPVTYHVVGIYQPKNENDPYWGQSELSATLQQQVGIGERATDAVFVTPDTIAATGATAVSVERDMVLGSGVLSVRDSIAISSEIFQASNTLRPQGYQVSSDFADLSTRIVNDTNLIFISVPLGAAELALFGWFAMYLAIRSTALARRFDIGVLKLRGLQRRNLWKLVVEQSLLPLLAGLPIGAIVGFLAARGVEGSIRAGNDIRLAFGVAAAAAVAAMLGGLLAALIAERSALATPVGELLRSTPARRRAWQANLIDGALVLIAVAGVVQIHLSGGAGGTTVSAIAPALVAFGAGIIAARLLAPLAARSVVAARRAGATKGLLTATYLARRPGLDRIFALLTIAVALCGYSIMAASTASDARSDRSTLELGPSTVLSTAPVQPERLLQAVRAADPAGRYAMAATVDTDAGAHVLAVDSARLPSVLPSVLPDGTSGGISGARLRDLLRPTPIREIYVTGTALAADIDATVPGSAPAYVTALMIGATGYIPAVFGPLHNGFATYTAGATGCSAARPCEFSGIELTGVRPSGGPTSPLPNPGVSVVVSGLRAGTHPILGTSQLRSLAWRPTTDARKIGPVITATASGLSLAAPAKTYAAALNTDPTAYLPSTPSTAPVVIAGPADAPAQPGYPTVAIFGFAEIPVRVVGTTSLLPRLETRGTIVDLDYGQALAGGETGVQRSEVWLAAGTPARIKRALIAQGLTITGTETVAGRSAAYAAEPSVVGLRFQELGGLLALLIAAVALLLVASVEARPRARELVALRRQGVLDETTRAVSYRIYAILAGGALIAGLIAALADRLLSGTGQLFRDGWRVLPPPPTLTGYGMLATVVVTAVTLAVAALVAARQVIRAQKREAS